MRLQGRERGDRRAWVQHGMEPIGGDIRPCRGCRGQAVPGNGQGHGRGGGRGRLSRAGGAEGG